MRDVKHDGPSSKKTALLIAAVSAAIASSGCKTLDTAVESARKIFVYVTTPCPLGTEYVVSTETGTPGLKKFTEKWCQRRDDHGERVRYGPYVELYEKGHKKESGQYAADGKRDGSWSRWYAGGQLEAVVKYDDGKPISFSAWHENGMKWEEGGFDRGFKNGTWIRWYSNGQKEFEATYDHGVLDREYTLWHDNGQKQEHGVYKHGVREGMWVTWHPNGQRRTEILFHDDKPDDWYKAWHENGQPSEQALFHAGKPEGMYTIWHDNGQKEEEGSYHDGQLDGKVTAWDREGHVWLKTEYKGGALANDPTAAPPAPPSQAGAPAVPADVK
jgi:antitoxin component YwqK of YwqJK toxin-antitoxin module